MSERPVIGLALGYGGARGFCHVGVVRALAEMGIVPDVVAGTSMGAVVGAVVAAGRLDAFEDWSKGLNRARFLTMLDPRISGGGLVEGGEIAALMERIGVPDSFDALEKPFAAVATDMVTGREVWLREGSVRASVRASAALPGILTPHVIGGQTLLDGALTNPLPVSVCHALGADVVIAVSPNAKLGGTYWEPPQRAPWWPSLEHLKYLFPIQSDNEPADAAPGRAGYFQVVSAAIEIMTEQWLRARLAQDPPHVLLTPDLTDMTILDFDRAAHAIVEGRRVVKENAAALAQFTPSA